MNSLSTARLRAILAVLACTLACAAAGASEDRDGFSAGLSVQPRASATDIGLPVYPGATPERERDDDSDGATISLWGGPFGMDLRVVKLRSADSADTVSRFYRDALERQGRLVDCSRDAPPEAPAPAASGTKLLRCGSDRGKPGGHLYKLGVPGGVRIVAIEPADGGSRIQLVRLLLRGD